MKNKLPKQPAMKRKVHKKLNPTRNTIKTVAMKKRVKELKEKRKAQKEALEAAIQSVPRSLIIGKGKVLPPPVKQLIKDLRNVMMPYTAQQMELHPTTKWNVIKEACQNLIITHTIALKTTVGGCALIISRMPHGPTLHFSVSSFCTCSDLKEYFDSQGVGFKSTYPTDSPPLVVLNNFVTDGDDKTAATVKLIAVTLQNMFPPVDVKRFNLSTTCRVVMFDYDPEEECIHMRHYLFKVKESGKGKHNKMKELVKLKELGPRLTMSLRLVTEGAMEGDIIYNKDSTLTPKEIEQLRMKKAEKKALKEHRKKTQEENVEKKKQEKEGKKKAHPEAEAAWERKLATAGKEDGGFETVSSGFAEQDSDEEMDSDEE